MRRTTARRTPCAPAARNPEADRVYVGGADGPGRLPWDVRHDMLR
ncbi:hypothetical protein [Streptomyces sulfonofaciens]|nr:hypothetical protein [Streptomyces sulfonofaciens]